MQEHSVCIFNGAFETPQTAEPFIGETGHQRQDMKGEKVTNLPEWSSTMPNRVNSIKLTKSQLVKNFNYGYGKDSYDRVGESGGNRNFFHSFGDRGQQVNPDEIEIQLDENIIDSNSNNRRRNENLHPIRFGRAECVESSQQNHNSLDSSINRKEGGELEIKQVFLIHDATTSNLDTNSFLVNQSSFLVNQSLMAN